MGLTFNMSGGIPKGTISVTVTNGTATSVTATMSGQSVSLTYNSTSGVWTAKVKIGTWSVTATDGTHSKSGNTTVTAGQTVSLSLKLPNLPNGYTEYTYIQGSANDSCYIDVGYKPVSNNRIKGKYMSLNASSGGNSYIFNSSSSSYGYIRLYQTSSNYTRYMSSTATTSGNYVTCGTATTNAREYNARQATISLDGTNYKISSGTRVTTGPMNLRIYFSGSASTYSKIRHYYVEIYNTGDTALVAKLIPAKRNSDGVIGLYDTIRNTFYTATGSLTAGSVVS